MTATRKDNLPVWIGNCPSCGTVRITSLACPDRCKNKPQKGKHSHLCNQPLTEVRSTRNNRHNVA